MKTTGSTDPKVLKNYLLSLKSYEGASGYLIFDDKGGVAKEPSFKKIVKNKLVELN